MTAQVGDRYLYQGGEFTIVTMNNKLEFHPYEYGLSPSAISTGCWRGYWCHYKISDQGIFLDKLHIHCGNENYPEINGISVKQNGKEPFEYMGYRVYNGLNIKVNYTGSILVGDGFIQDYYRHMGYQRSYSYKILKEFVFNNGTLVDVVDHSKLAESIREFIESASRDNPKKIIGFRGSGGRYVDEYKKQKLTKADLAKYWWL